MKRRGSSRAFIRATNDPNSRRVFSTKTDRSLYVLIGLAALGLITSANRLGGRGLQAIGATGFAWLAELCLPSFLVCLALYLWSRPARPLALPRPDTDRRLLLRLGGTWLLIWVAGSAIAALIAGHWIRYTTGRLAIPCLVVVGPLQEELFFRGALFELAERGWPASGTWGPIVATTLPFALQHFQFHGYRLDRAALFQVGFTLPMGMVFGRLRQASGSLWPGLVVHVLTNLTGAFGTGAH